MNGPALYLHFGFLLISVANLIVIALLVVVFVLAVALWRPEKQRLSTLESLPTPGEEGREADERETAEQEVRA
jgi:large-conductance mechanosensitive channel